MDRKNFIVLFTFFGIIAISGCTIPSGFDPFNSNTPSQTGAIIEDFTPDYSSVHSGEEVTFRMRVKNTGSLKLENGFAELLGVDQEWQGGGGTAVNNGEVFPVEDNCRYTKRGITLLPEDADKGTTGGEAVCTWKYIAPPVATGLSINAKPRVRFYYSYRSSTIKTVTLADREELRALENQGKALPMESYSQTKSPISISIEATTPVRTYSDKVEFPIVVTVKNIGGGTVCKGDSFSCKKEGGIGENKNWNRVHVQITLPAGMSTQDCSQDVTFVGTSPQVFSCKIVAEMADRIDIVQKQIEATAEYSYFIDKTTEVNVFPSNEPMK